MQCVCLVGFFCVCVCMCKFLLAKSKEKAMDEKGGRIVLSSISLLRLDKL